MLASVFLSVVGTAVALPDMVVDRDNVVIRESCRIIIPPGTVIEDTDDNGVIQIDADDITVEFADTSILTGNKNLSDRDLLKGVGIRIHSHHNVTLKNLQIRGYKLGLWADDTKSLTIDRANLKTMYSRRLLSTPEAEDSSDWFYPHHNDETPWRTEYGGAIVIERSSEPVIHDVVIREGQNGIILDRVNSGQIYDNDCSFLSGWGLAMWRSNHNIISHNAFDFCIRGYSHGIYNRGQDSAGILMFEQCSDNTIDSNSVTHGGDGIFGFAGREAIGEIATPGIDYNGLGCNDNHFIDNDLSYAAAHGFEMTFSYRNSLSYNIFTENAICGIWGGYSHSMIVSRNKFTGNGSAGYGLERGAINVEHGSSIQIWENQFTGNSVAVHFWWDDDGKLLKLPGIKTRDINVSDNVVAFNKSSDDDVFLRLRDVPMGKHIRNFCMHDNDVVKPDRKIDITSGIIIVTDCKSKPPPLEPHVVTPGIRQPVGARPELRGRQNIIMTQWGPWDHASPLVQIRPLGTQSVLIDVREPAIGAANESKAAEPAIKATGNVVLNDDAPKGEKRYKITPKSKSRLTPYTVNASLGQSTASRSGVLLDTAWDLTFFSWDKPNDPRENLDGWRKLSLAPEAIKAQTSDFKFNFGHRGPGALKLVPESAGKSLGNDHFGLIARSKFTIPAGDWKFTTQSDDGIRVKVNNQVVIENWTWHGPTTNDGTFHQSSDGEATIEVEYFEIDGFAVLNLDIQKVDK